MNTKNKIALVTGGSRGLGKNMAISLAKKGLHVILTYNSKKEEAEAVVNEIKSVGQKAVAIQLDVSQINTFNDFGSNVKTQLQATFQSEKIDFLINNAGIGIHNQFSNTTEKEFDELVSIQFKGPFFLTQKLLELLNDGGGIVNISTGLTRITFSGYSAYASLKTAMETLTRYQAKELGERKIRVNVIAPGAIETDFGGGVVRDNEQLNSMIAANTALGRVGLPDDIGGVVAFLCTDEARWITAQRIEVSGGQFL